MLHPDGGALKTMLLPFRLGVGGRARQRPAVLAWIHREDWVGLVELAGLTTTRLPSSGRTRAGHDLERDGSRHR